MQHDSTPGKTSPLVQKLAARILEISRRENHAVGHRLMEQTLSDALGVSRSPVRKALQFLETTGAVQSVPNRGFQLARQLAGPEHLELLAASDLEDEIYLRIANDRINGLLAEDFIETDLASQYGLAKPQVQRVLNRMARENLVDRKAGGRGWTFRPLLGNTESHRESYRFRMIIEPAALLEPGYQVDLDELEKCRIEQRDLLDGGIERCTPAELYRAGVHFHETLVAGAHNSLLLDALKTVNQMRRVLEYGTRLDRSRLHTQCQEHLQLIELLKQGERMEASLFLRQHLNAARITKVGETTAPAGQKP